jgi:tripartite-type tricarboxylate transporter receptor subunit TctC
MKKLPYDQDTAFAPLGYMGSVPLIVAVNNDVPAKNLKDVQEKFASIGFAVEPGTPEALAQRSRLETAKWAKAIRDAKIEPQ